MPRSNVVPPDPRPSQSSRYRRPTQGCSSAGSRSSYSSTRPARAQAPPLRCSSPGHVPTKVLRPAAGSLRECEQGDALGVGLTIERAIQAAAGVAGDLERSCEGEVEVTERSANPTIALRSDALDVPPAMQPRRPPSLHEHGRRPAGARAQAAVPHPLLWLRRL